MTISESSIGVKLAAMTWTQKSFLVVGLTIVIWNVFIPRRINRFNKNEIPRDRQANLKKQRKKLKRRKQEEAD